MFNNTLGTVEIAKMIGMSRITVHSWIVKGDLKAERTPGRHFRVQPQDLVDYLRKRNVPVPDQLRSLALDERCVVISRDWDLTEKVREALKPGDGLAPMEVQVFSEPLLALMDIGARPPAILITEMVLPQVNAHALVRAVLDRCPSIRVIGLSRTGSNGERDSAMSAGVNEFLAAPFDPRDIRIRVQAVL